MTAPAEPVFCANDGAHDTPAPAVARISWPDGPYMPTTACLEDLLEQIEESYTEGNPVRVEPIAEAHDDDEDAETTYLVWSNEHRAWWGPSNSGYTGDLWSAGRYTFDAARKACNGRDWPQDAPPPEVMVAAPESAHPRFTAKELRAVPILMRQRVDDAVKRAMESREQRGETIVLQRACNGCGRSLRDVNDLEVDAAMNGKRLPDVRHECPDCSAALTGSPS